MPAVESPPEEQTTGKYAEQLQAGLPELDTGNLKIIGDGWDHVAVELDGAIFRLPKDHKQNPKREAHVKYEVAALKLLQDGLGVAVPNPIYVSQDFEFFGYPAVEGILASKAKHRAGPEQADQFLQDWAKIAAAIHRTITPDQANGIGVPAVDTAKHISQAEKVFGIEAAPEYMRHFTRATIDKIQAADIVAIPKVFLHNDFHSENILLDPETLHISGVIDWSDMAIGPPECELAIFEGGDPPSYLDRAAELYKHQTGIEIDKNLARTLKHLQKLRIYVYQTERGDPKDAKQSEQKILQWMESSR